VKRWILVEKSRVPFAESTSSTAVTQREACELVRKNVKGCGGLLVCADEKIRYAKSSGGKIDLGNRRHLEFREWP
jgi:hypothetical protein